MLGGGLGTSVRGAQSDGSSLGHGPESRESRPEAEVGIKVDCAGYILCQFDKD